MNITQTVTKSTLAAAVIALVAVPSVFALTNAVVTPIAPGDWTLKVADAGGAVNYVNEGAPNGLGVGSLKLTTGADAASQASLGRLTSLPLSELATVSYWTKQVAAPTATGNASFQLGLMLTDATDSDVTFVYEPGLQSQFNPSASAVQAGNWQQWDVRSGIFQASKSYSGSFGDIIGGTGNVSYYTIDDILAFFPTAKVSGYGVNVGKDAPSHDIRVDGVQLNDTVYDFEFASSYTMPLKDQCKDDGWMNLKTSEGISFKNQGNCVSYALK